MKSEEASGVVTDLGTLATKVSIPCVPANFWAAAHLETLSCPILRRSSYQHDWLFIRWTLPKHYSELALNCTHRFWLVKSKTTLCCFLLRHHFWVRMVTALQWPGSKLAHVTMKPEVFLYMNQIIPLL